MADQESSFAFKAVATDDVGSLAGVLEGCAVQDWTKWHNRADQSLVVLCKERAAFRAYSFLAGSLNLRDEVASLTPECDKVVKAFRAVAHDDMASLAAILGGLPATTWLRWQNKAKKDLLTMSRERNSKGAFALLRRALISPLPAESSTHQLPQRAPVGAELSRRSRMNTAKSMKSCVSAAQSEVWQDDTAHLNPPRICVQSCDDIDAEEKQGKEDSDEEHIEDLSVIEDETKQESPNEKRLAEDGNAYTKDEFIAFLGPEEAQRQWDKAERVLEKRLADDGKAYTRDEFMEFLGSEDGQRSWDNAKPA